MKIQIFCSLLAAFILHTALCQIMPKDDNKLPTAARVLKDMQSPDYWRNEAQQTLRSKLMQSENANIAKNVILFIGDGMSLPTVTAARIYEGQLKHSVGERNQLSFEQFPHVGLAKTYCVDRQVPDSACTAAAYLGGVKSKYSVLGLGPNVELNDCDAASDPQNQLESLADWALQKGKATGIVTTTRITDASPATVYAHSANRNFESDYAVLQRGFDSRRCVDIARQLIENKSARDLKVVLGGGFKKFLPRNMKLSDGFFGERRDGRNLVEEWKTSKRGNGTFVHTRKQLMDTNLRNTDFLLGLFAPEDMQFHLDSATEQPLLREMTATAIKMLQKNNKGFFLFVEGGRIDHAHHRTQARKALDETVQFSHAVQMAYNLTDPKDTLIVVTADHGHTMTVSGLAGINNPITGLSSSNNAADGLPSSTLSYADGPGFKTFYSAPKAGEVRRVDLNTLSDLRSGDFQFPAGAPAMSESHDAADVPIYASGPWSHLFTGVLEQSALPALMGFAACMGPGKRACA